MARRKTAIPASARRAVASREGGAPKAGGVPAACVYCGAPGSIHWFRLASGRFSGWVTFRGLELDHVEPEAAGGDSSAANLVLACQRCNRSKGIRKAPKARR
jgi:5-methylcytosine-specific restriction endonuclease McrA